MTLLRSNARFIFGLTTVRTYLFLWFHEVGSWRCTPVRVVLLYIDFTTRRSFTFSLFHFQALLLLLVLFFFSLLCNNWATVKLEAAPWPHVVGATVLLGSLCFPLLFKSLTKRVGLTKTFARSFLLYRSTFIWCSKWELKFQLHYWYNFSGNFYSNSHDSHYRSWNRYLVINKLTKAFKRESCLLSRTFSHPKP